MIIDRQLDFLPILDRDIEITEEMKVIFSELKEMSRHITVDIPVNENSAINEITWPMHCVVGHSHVRRDKDSQWWEGVDETIDNLKKIVDGGHNVIE